MLARVWNLDVPSNDTKIEAVSDRCCGKAEKSILIVVADGHSHAVCVAGRLTVGLLTQPEVDTLCARRLFCCMRMDDTG